MEFAAAWLSHQKLPFMWMYHIYVLFEYTLLSLYFLALVERRFRKLVVVSIPVFVAASLLISYRLYDFNAFPGQNINTEGIFIFALSALTLFNLDVKMHSNIAAHPDFWIICGLLVFFGVTFFSNWVFTYLYGLDRNRALELFTLINKPLNIILYTCLIVGFICALRPRSTTPLL